MRLSRSVLIAGICVLIGIGLLAWRVRTPPAPTITAQQVYERLHGLGLATNGRTVPGPGLFPDCPDRYGFDIPRNDRSLGVVFICPKDVADRVMAQPTATPETTGFLAGASLAPRTFQSAGGTVLVSISALVDPGMVDRIRSEVALIPE
jgi:hypothetical protein